MTLEFVRSWDIEEGRDPDTIENLREQYAEGRLANDSLPNEVDFRDWLASKIGDVHALWLPGTWPSVGVQGKHTVCGEQRQWALLSAGAMSQPTCDLCVMILRGDLGRAADLIIARRGRLPEISYGRCEAHGLQGCSQCAQPVEPGPVAPTTPTTPTIPKQPQRTKMICVWCWAETYVDASIEGALEAALGRHWELSPSCRDLTESNGGKAYR